MKRNLAKFRTLFDPYASACTILFSNYSYATISSFGMLLFLGFIGLPAVGRAVELKMSRAALERPLKQQLFSGPDERYYLKRDAKSACSCAEKSELSFVGDRVVIQVKIHARLGTSLAGNA